MESVSPLVKQYTRKETIAVCADILLIPAESQITSPISINSVMIKVI